MVGLNKRGQSAFEFIMLLGFALLFVLIIFYLLQTTLLDLQKDKNREEIKQVANILTTELSLAEASPTQYSRTFLLPSTIRGNVYDISSPDGREIVIHYLGEQYVYFLSGQPLLNYTNLGPGENSLRKRCLSQTDCLLELYTPSIKTQTWWNALYLNRKEVIINNTGSTVLSGYPVFLVIPKAQNMQPDFSDVTFLNGRCNSSGGTSLDYELGSYTSVSASFWVKVPSLTVGENKICMYYNNPGPFSTPAESAVWDQNFAIVQHFEDNSTLESDSTVNNNEGQLGGGNGASMPTWETGLSPETLRTPTCDNISSFGTSSGATISIDSGRAVSTASATGTGGIYHLGISGNDQYYAVGDKIQMVLDIDFADTGITSAYTGCYTTGVVPYSQITDTKILKQGINLVTFTVTSAPVASVTCRIWADGMVPGSNFTVDDWSSKRINNRLGGSYKYDGLNDYIDFGNDQSLNISGALTIQLWLKIPGNPSVYDKNWYIFGRGDGLSGATTTGAYVLSYYKGNNKLYFDIDNGTIRDAVITTLASWTDQWYYIVAKWDGTKDIYGLKIYVDSVINGQATSNIDFLRTDGPTIRSGFRNLNYFNGSIDEIRISNIARSDDWIKQDYQMVNNQDTLVSFGVEENKID